MRIEEFQKVIWAYYCKNGRSLPWRETDDPYAILVSEMMLQQTQVDRVLPKYESFLEKFPDFETLANAPVSMVIGAWQGLGYNRRALRLKHLSEAILSDYGGVLPRERDELEKLPGIGPATSGALLAFVYGEGYPFIETNIRRVYIHFFFSRKKEVHDDEINDLVIKSLDKNNPRDWYYALMDYGSMLGRERKNVNVRSAHYAKQSKFEGSRRQLRGRVLSILLQDGPQSFSALENTLRDERTEEVICVLEKEGFIQKNKSILSLVQ